MFFIELWRGFRTCFHSFFTPRRQTGFELRQDKRCASVGLAEC